MNTLELPIVAVYCAALCMCVFNFLCYIFQWARLHYNIISLNHSQVYRYHTMQNQNERIRKWCGCCCCCCCTVGYYNITPMSDYRYYSKVLEGRRLNNRYDDMMADRILVHELNTAINNRLIVLNIHANTLQTQCYSNCISNKSIG